MIDLFVCVADFLGPIVQDGNLHRIVFANASTISNSASQRSVRLWQTATGPDDGDQHVSDRSGQTETRVR